MWCYIVLEQGVSFHLFKTTFMSFRSIFTFSSYCFMYFLYLFKYFLFYDNLINEVCFLIISSNWLFENVKGIDFYILNFILCWLSDFLVLLLVVLVLALILLDFLGINYIIWVTDLLLFQFLRRACSFRTDVFILNLAGKIFAF